VIALLLAPSLVRADGTQIGGFVGPRIFASDAMLGYIPDAPAHPSLGSSMMFGGRIAHPLFEYVIPEFELALSPTTTNSVGGADSASVLWIDPRLHIRFQFMSGQRLQPFVVVGGGSPIAISSARQTFDSGIVGAGYAGGGVRFDTNKGFLLRFDARIVVVPGKKWVDNADEGSYLKPEVDISLGIEFQLGKRKRAKLQEGPLAEADDDKDGIANAKDACIDRPEDADGFDDLDGCPDIDNDTDRVLDIADKCSTVPETYNGFQDDDGCPDSIPAEVDTLRGTIEAAGTDELVVRRDGSTSESLRLSPQQLAKLEVARGRRSHWLKGAIIGFVPGAVLMGIAVVGTAECDPDCEKTDEVLGYGLLGGAITGSVGALVGLVIKTDRWVPVRERRPSVALALAPAGGGFRAGLSLRF
jgi:hypothetical protein